MVSGMESPLTCGVCVGPNDWTELGQLSSREPLSPELTVPTLAIGEVLQYGPVQYCHRGGVTIWASPVLVIGEVVNQYRPVQYCDGEN